MPTRDCSFPLNCEVIMIHRRSLLRAALAAPLVLSLPPSAFAAVRNPSDFGTVGAGDDTAAINAALAAIRADGGGVLELDGAKTAGGYQTAYLVGPLNATNCSKLKIQCDPH